MELLGPAPHDSSRQSRQDQGFSRTDFTIDWGTESAVCPGGHRSFEWWEQKHHRNGTPVRKVFFSAEHCRPCPKQAQCTKPLSGRRGRGITFLPRERHEALEAARQAQDTDAWKARYAIRAGVEGTISQAVRVTGLRRTRYRNLPTTRLGHVFAATALNIMRRPMADRHPARRHPLLPLRSPHTRRLTTQFAALSAESFRPGVKRISSWRRGASRCCSKRPLPLEFVAEPYRDGLTVDDLRRTHPRLIAVISGAPLESGGDGLSRIPVIGTCPGPDEALGFGRPRFTVTVHPDPITTAGQVAFYLAEKHDVRHVLVFGTYGQGNVEAEVLKEAFGDEEPFGAVENARQTVTTVIDHPELLSAAELRTVLDEADADAAYLIAQSWEVEPGTRALLRAGFRGPVFTSPGEPEGCSAGGRSETDEGKVPDGVYRAREVAPRTVRADECVPTTASRCPWITKLPDRLGAMEEYEAAQGVVRAFAGVDDRLSTWPSPEEFGTALGEELDGQIVLSLSGWYELNGDHTLSLGHDIWIERRTRASGRCWARWLRCSTEASERTVRATAPSAPESHRSLSIGLLRQPLVRVGPGCSRPRGGAACRHSPATLWGALSGGPGSKRRQLSLGLLQRSLGFRGVGAAGPVGSGRVRAARCSVRDPRAARRPDRSGRCRAGARP
ncbi:transposase [Streptomyces tailanensis]|uniref:transposase n=1 Tax=Streptomyces tailanensis TaxID=2569858 RepID=UPI00122E3BB2|nr:transposase [Streptomyces tailanensis]